MVSFRLLVPSRCGEGLALLSPSSLLRLLAPPLCPVPALGCSTKAPAFCAFPAPSNSGSQELDGRTLPGAACLLPSAAPATVPTRAGRVPAPCVSPRPCRQMSTIQNLRRSLIRNWRAACSAVGAAVLGAEPAPFPSPCLLPLAGLGRGP